MSYWIYKGTHQRFTRSNGGTIQRMAFGFPQLPTLRNAAPSLSRHGGTSSPELGHFSLSQTKVLAASRMGRYPVHLSGLVVEPWRKKVGRGENSPSCHLILWGCLGETMWNSSEKWRSFCQKDGRLYTAMPGSVPACKGCHQNSTQSRRGWV